MVSRNDITGEKIITKPSTNSYADGWERIFGKKRKKAQHMKGSAIDSNKVEAVVNMIFGEKNATSSKKKRS